MPLDCPATQAQDPSVRRPVGARLALAMFRDGGQERPPVALQFDLSHAVDAQELRVVGRPEKAHFDQRRIAEYDVRRDAPLLCQPFAQLSQALEQGDMIAWLDAYHA